MRVYSNGELCVSKLTERNIKEWLTECLFFGEFFLRSPCFQLKKKNFSFRELSCAQSWEIMK